jgi:pimeloyl-ACP methyl ester carboxylesterase
MDAKRMWKNLARGTGWAIAGLFGLLIGLSAIGASYQAYVTHRDRTDFPPPGEMVDLGTHRLHLDCRGSGDITLILDAGAQLWSNSWRWVQQNLAADHRVCAYDRAGLGWSDPSDAPNDLIGATDDLHALLATSGETGPFVHAGHSLGGMLSRVHHARYPDDLTAMVMIDPGEPPILIEDFEAVRGAPPKGCSMSCRFQIGLAYLGVTRVVLQNLDLLDDPSYPADAIAEFRALAPLPDAIRTALDIAHQTPRMAFQTLDAGRITDRPVLLIYSGEYGELVSDGEPAEEMARWRAWYQQEWRANVEASPAGVGPVEIPGANHLTVIVGEQYALQVAAEIRAFVRTLR